jgi:hypothetical protein
MLALEWIAERRIDEAAARGELDGLPGAGQPLDLYEDPLVPAEMKMAKRILGNSGIALAEIFGELRGELRNRHPRAVAAATMAGTSSGEGT